MGRAGIRRSQTAGGASRNREERETARGLFRCYFGSSCRNQAAAAHTTATCWRCPAFIGTAHLHGEAFELVQTVIEAQISAAARYHQSAALVT
jgi:hypothetical protein